MQYFMTPSLNSPMPGANHGIFHQRLLNMIRNPPQPPIPDRGISQKTLLNLPCGKDLNHLRIQLSDGLNLTAFLDHLETCEKCSRCQGKLIRGIEWADWRGGDEGTL
jgi:hypothetical protein